MSISIISILEHSLRDKTDNPSAIASAMLSGCPIIAASPGNGGYAYCVVLVDLRRYAITTIKCGKASPAELEGMAGCGVVLSSDCGGISRCVRFNGDAGAKEIMSYLGRKLERARTLTALIQGLGGLAPEGNTLVMQPAYAGAFVRAYASPDKAVIISNYLGRAVLLRASAGEVNKYALALDSYLAQGALKRMGITTCISRAVELYMCVRGGGRCAAAPCQGEGDEDLKGALRAIASGEVGAVIKLFGIAIADFTSRRHLITGRLTRWSKHMDAYADLLRVARDLLSNTAIRRRPLPSH
ncbi:hypothetical protein [Vulcanisaeta sp. JCM 16159]|uniref:hypothetical protein n=1 Tax=Vulcanisaeta sp. JCM 16159 TaxID=1295371 RepID=UPI0006D19B61|nr:hypothetical protein [Vulcanisaeta sp. JCM 16159]